MTKIKLGDVFEIKTSKGKAYIHYVYKDKGITELIRVLPGLYPGIPKNLNQLLASKERYMVFFPLGAAYKRKLVEKVGNYPLVNFEKPKYMRTEHFVGSEFKGWDIVDTDTWHNQLVLKLSEQQKQMSPWGVWNDTLLIENLEKDWSLDKWV